MKRPFCPFHYGIVLRSYSPYQQKVVLLDQACGLIEATFFKKNYSTCINHGMLIRYTLQKTNDRFRLDDIVLLAGPAEWVADDIFFLHHVLELAHAFLSYHQIAQDVFELFTRIYKPLETDQCLWFKQCFLCKFFALLGICPEDESSFCPRFFSLISGSIDTMVKSQSAFVDVTQISRWLHGCIAVHPDAHSLKTTFFLTQMDDHEV